MTINLGNTIIAGAYLGSNKVSRMYLGDVLVYGELPTTTREKLEYNNGIETGGSTAEIPDNTIQ